MKAKRKLLISMLAIVFVLLAVVATIAIAFALTQQTITTTLNIGYVVEDIDGTASATYTIGGVTESLTAMKGDNVIGDTLVFHAGDTEDAGNLMFPEGQIPLSAQNDNIVIQYTYSNTGAKHYIASMSFDGNISADNMKVEYSINGTDYSTNRYAVVVPANTANRSYWIKISIENKAKSASFTGDFKWLLEGCDEQSKEYLSLTSVEFQSTGTTGEYQVGVANSGSYVGELVFPSSVNGDPVTTIAENTSLTQEQKNQITSVYIPDSVTTIGRSAFQNFTNLETINFEQDETESASVASSTGLTTIGWKAFMGCVKLKDFIIPDTVQNIAGEAFVNCASLTEIIIPDGVSALDYGIFEGCSSVTAVTIGRGLEFLDPGGVFAGLNELTSLKVVEGNTVYHSSGNCIIETANQSLVAGCKTSVIPTDDSVTRIYYSAFQGMYDLKSILIPENIKYISSGAFAGTGLVSAVFQNTIGWNASYFENQELISSEQLADPANAATLLKNTYVDYDWTRS